MALSKYVKAAGETKRYQIDYTNWLDAGEQAVSVAFSILNNTVTTPLAIINNVILPTAMGAQYYISGGVDGVTYKVIATLTTNVGPQVKVDEILVTIREPA